MSSQITINKLPDTFLNRFTTFMYAFNSIYLVLFHVIAIAFLPLFPVSSFFFFLACLLLDLYLPYKTKFSGVSCSKYIAIP